MFCQGNETAKGIMQKTVTKLQQQLNIDTANYQLWEVRDGFCRRIGDNEKLLAIHKSQSAIVFTDKLKEVVHFYSSLKNQWTGFDCFAHFFMKPAGTPTVDRPKIKISKRDASPAERASAGTETKDKTKLSASTKPRKKTTSKKSGSTTEESSAKTRGSRSESIGGREKKERPADMKKQQSLTSVVPAPPPISGLMPSQQMTPAAEGFVAWIFADLPNGSIR